MCFKGRNALFRYVSALAGYLFAPNILLQHKVGLLQRKLGLPEEYLGVHIRHGDSCTALHAHVKVRVCVCVCVPLSVSVSWYVCMSMSAW